MNRILLIFVCLSCLSLTAEETEIAVYCYHSDAPFLLESQPLDLSRLWVKKFNEWSKDKKLKLVRIKRPQLNSLVESGQPYIILWANALWFKQRDPQVLESSPVFYDADVWLSSSSRPIDYEQPEDLSGLTMGGRLGYFYKGVDALVKKGKVKRLDNPTDTLNLSLLRNGTIDIFVMSRSSLFYWMANLVDLSNTHIADSPHDAYTRHLLFSPNYSSLKVEVDEFNQSLKQNEEWNNQLTQWGINKLVEPYELEIEELIKIPLSNKTEKAK